MSRQTPSIAVPTTPEQTLRSWGQVLDHLEQQRKISLRGYYEFARVLRWTATEIELGFASDDEGKWAGENASDFEEPIGPSIRRRDRPVARSLIHTSPAIVAAAR